MAGPRRMRRTTRWLTSRYPFLLATSEGRKPACARRGWRKRSLEQKSKRFTYIIVEVEVGACIMQGLHYLNVTAACRDMSGGVARL